MSDPLQLQPEGPPPVEHVQLGEQTLELDPQSAAAVRSAFEGLAQQYSQALEQYRQQALQSIGTPMQPGMLPPEPADLSIPDPDLLFSNKAGWTDEFKNALEQRLSGLEGKQTQLVAGAVQAFQQELARRDMAQAAQSRHDAAMEEMLSRRGLEDNTLVVQAVYNREYDKLRNLPLEMALDKIGALAEQEIAKIRHGEQWTLERGQQQTTAPKPPPVVRSGRRASAAPAPAPEQLPPGGIAPGGGLSAMGKIIRKHQQAMLRGAA